MVLTGGARTYPPFAAWREPYVASSYVGRFSRHAVPSSKDFARRVRNFTRLIPRRDVFRFRTRA